MPPTTTPLMIVWPTTVITGGCRQTRLRIFYLDTRNRTAAAPRVPLAYTSIIRPTVFSTAYKYLHYDFGLGSYGNDCLSLLRYDSLISIYLFVFVFFFLLYVIVFSFFFSPVFVRDSGRTICYGVIERRSTRFPISNTAIRKTLYRTNVP